MKNILLLSLLLVGILNAKIIIVKNESVFYKHSLLTREDVKDFDIDVNSNPIEYIFQERGVKAKPIIESYGFRGYTYIEDEITSISYETFLKDVVGCHKYSIISANIGVRFGSNFVIDCKKEGDK